MTTGSERDSARANPYRPPATESLVDVTFRPDTEFLISHSKILCRETVEFPRVCIHTGASDNLVKKTHRYFDRADFANSIINIMRVMFWVGVIAAGLNLLRVCSPAQLCAIAVGACLLRIGVGRLPWKKWFSGQVSVTWYVSQDFMDRRRRRGLNLAVAACAMAVVFVAVFALRAAYPQAYFDLLTMTENLQFLALGILFMAGGAWQSMTVPKLNYHGRYTYGIHKGLQVFTGHSQAFTEAVERIIHDGD